MKKYITKKVIFFAVALVFGMVLSSMAAHYGNGYLVLSTAAIMAGAIAIDRRVE